MVLFEMGIGSLAGFGPGAAVKLVAASSGGTAALLGPTPAHITAPTDVVMPHPLDASVPGHETHLSVSEAASWLWPKLTMIADELTDCAMDLGSSVTAPVASVVTSGISSSMSRAACELIVGGGAVLGIMQVMGYCGKERRREGDEEVGFKDYRVVPKFIAICAISDVIKTIAVVDSLGAPLAVPLRTFALGGVLLGFPTSYVVDWCKSNTSFRKAVLIELAACAVSLFWLSWGTHLLCISPSDAVTAPLLFWVCFVHCVLTWSGFSCAITVTLLSSAASAMLSGSK